MPPHFLADTEALGQTSNKRAAARPAGGKLHRRWFIPAKLVAPTQNVALVSRAGLIKKLEPLRAKRLGLVVAPAGFGKTTLMAQWQAQLRAEGAHVAWLSLDEDDKDPLQILSYMILALTASGIDLGALKNASERGILEGAVRPTMVELLERIAEVEDSVVLVLDDYHRVTSPDVDRLLMELVNSMPDNFTIILNSRSKPTFDLPRLLAMGWASEFDASALRLSKEELDTAVDQKLTTAERDILFQRTEGWFIAVQLARLMMREGESIEACLTKFKGDDGHIANYLAQQVLGSLPDDLQRFLTEMSILDAFDASLADAVTGRQDSLAVLRELEPLQALLSPIQDQPGWYRYHQLFAECLQDILRRRSGAGIAQLHLRASIWFESRGNVVAAARHASEALDYDRCARLIQEAGGWELILFGGIGYLRNLLRFVPDQVLQRYPRLQVAKAYLSAKDGDLATARALFNLARANALEVTAGSALARDLLNIGALLHIYEDRHLRPADLDAMNSRISRLPPGDPLTAAILDCEYILANISLGRFEEAERRANDAVLLMQEAQSVLGLNYCYLHAGMAALYQGNLRSAESLFELSMRMAAGNFDSDPCLKALSALHYYTLMHWRGKIAPDDHDMITADIDYVEAYDGWFELYANGLLVEASMLESPSDAVARAYRIAGAGGLDRLRELADIHQLRDAPDHEAQGLAARILAKSPKDGWRHDPFRWRPFVEGRTALARHFASTDRARGLQFAAEAIDCARAVGAIPFQIDALVVQAELLHLAGDRQAALVAIEEALALAAPGPICGPFDRSPNIGPTLRAYVKTAGASEREKSLSAFAGALLARSVEFQRQALQDPNILALSQREHEVLGGLLRQQSNKQIARTLGVSEHTVKFHLKNLFFKLGVERRGEAIAKARGMGLS